MSKEHIDTLFQQKLGDHRTPPPAELWDRLEDQLGEEEPDRKGGGLWLRVAAAVALLLLAVYWVYEPGTGLQGTTVAQNGENEEVQNLAATGENEEVQNLAFTGENEEVQNRLADTGENEEVQNRAVEAVPSLTETATVVADAGGEVRVQNVNAHATPALLALPTRGFALTDEQPVLASVAVQSVPLPEPPNVVLMPDLEVSKDISLDKAVALAQEVKEGEVSLADLRAAKADLGTEGFSLAALREAKNEFLRFEWIDD